MFTAYSRVKQKNVDVDTEFNLDEEFGCPNPDCSAIFKIRSAFGKRKKHFARVRGNPHIHGCYFATPDDRYAANDELIKTSVMDIFEGVSCKRAGGKAAKGTEKGDATPFLYVHTPKQLYKFCCANNLTAEYRDGMTVNDIVLDCRNLASSGLLKGFNGIRLAIGKTVRYEGNNKIHIVVEGRGPRGRRISLNAEVTMSEDQHKSLLRHILDTNENRFADCPIAVLADWHKTKDYAVAATVKHPLHLIYRI